MERKVIFSGLTVQEFIHPGEEEAKQSLIQTSAFQKMIGMVSDANQKIYQTVTKGSYLRLSPEIAPRLYSILRDVCRILDYPNVPQIYLCHIREQRVRPYSGEENYLLVSDYVADNYDDDMLAYMFGNAVTMLKAGHVEMTTVAGYLRQSLTTLPFTIEFKRYLHLADATSDRGGLLACQSLAGAARCHFEELGLPACETYKLFRTDKEAAAYIRRYLREVEKKNGRDGTIVNAASWWIDMNYVEAAPNQMLEGLYTWCFSGYQTLMARYRS